VERNDRVHLSPRPKLSVSKAELGAAHDGFNTP
jgi:hypothetical protein